jgi:HSP20 family protein
MSRLEVWHHAEPTFREEFSDPLGTGRFHGEWKPAANQSTFRPPFDVFETDRAITIKVEIAGMREEDFSIALEGRILHISGVRRDTPGKLAYQRMEINYGLFSLDIQLPHLVAEADIEAAYDRGFLSVSVPRRPNQRRIPVVEAHGE